KLTERLQRSNTRGDSGQRIVNLCILPLHPGLNALALGQTLCARLSRQIDAGPDAPVALLDPERVAGLLGLDVTRLGEETTPEHPRLLLWLEQQELGHRLQIWVARAEDCPWTRLCLRHADQVLLAADADSSPEPSLVERRYLQPDSTPRPAQSLWLLHPTDRTIPRGTAAWLAARPQLDSARFSHFHTRRQHQGDWDRLARILSGRATGLVFAGGGARGFAQLGVMQALEEQGREWDMVAGTSIGAVMAAYAGMDLNCDRLIRLAGQAFSRNPTGDFNWLPLFSLFRGKRLARVIRDAVQAAVGAPIDIEDLWKPYFCVASNFSRGEMQVLRRGNLASCITASVSIPALLPPVLWQGELLTDGGSFNNYPVDLMRQAGASQVIGVSMSRKVSEPLPFSRLPGLGEILFDRLFRPRARQKYRALPHMAGMLIHVAAMSSACHEKRMQADVDLGFTPDVSAIGTLDWSAFDRVVAIGREHARAVLTSRSTPPG
ncbi:MAG: hypothetical protein RIR00_2628, partial [Pseudomonadota bacterium]